MSWPPAWADRPTLIPQIENFVAPSTGTYYVEVTGDPGVQYSLTVTRSANFDIEPNNTINTAQSLTGTNGVLGALDPGGSLTVGTSFEGIDFNGSNCGCLPPDTNAAVGHNYVVETVNLEIRVYDKTTGNILLDEPSPRCSERRSGGDAIRTSSTTTSPTAGTSRRSISTANAATVPGGVE